LFLYLSLNKKDFLFRCSFSTFAEVKKTFYSGKEDAIIRLYPNKENKVQINEIKKRFSFDIKDVYIDVRLVVVTLNTGEKGLLITSLLDQNKYSKEDFEHLYGLRWRIEENYKWHKVAFELENFSGHTELAIEQEFFSLVLTANMASLLIQEAQDEIKEEAKTKSLKHNYKINKRIAAATIRERLLIAILDPEIDMEAVCKDLKTELKKNLSPIRLHRKYLRPRKGRRKHGCTTRKCI
jgi:Transposase DDE domain